MSTVILALGLVLVIEGLALALAPSRIEDLLRIISAMTSEQRRRVGMAAVALGAIIAALAKWLGL